MKLKSRVGLLGVALMLAGCGGYPTREATVAQSWSGDVAGYRVWPGEVQETSGLAMRAGLFWTLNDSGDGPYLYAIDEQDNLTKKVALKGAENIDWEELAQDDRYLYVADCGNNRGRRKHLQIYKIAWDKLDRSDHGDSVEVTTLEFSYANRPDVVDSKAHNLDCEALTVVGDELWLFSKNRRDEQTTLYKLDKHKPVQVLQPVASYPVNGLITAADYHASSQRLILLGYSKQRIFGSSFVWVVPVQGAPQWSAARRLNMTPYAQWEALVWDRNDTSGRVWLSAERSPLLEVGLGSLTLPE
ncbi:hypothetical protein [Neptuniibacter halophilus]|uniref:hypothetical protein n=1 Tax=Neptuniibacter halophilus TaxID=651666 RepID=UPI00257439AE|nr:hypothetical protein [Neptuniibacter halophilus]